MAANPGISASVAQALAASSDWEESTTAGAIGCLDINSFQSINNSTGFCALPTGIRTDNGSFAYVGNFCAWWTITQNNNTSSWFKSLNFYGTTLGSNFYNKQYGLAVRCVKD